MDRGIKDIKGDGQTSSGRTTCSTCMRCETRFTVFADLKLAYVVRTNMFETVICDYVLNCVRFRKSHTCPTDVYHFDIFVSVRTGDPLIRFRHCVCSAGVSAH